MRIGGIFTNLLTHISNLLKPMITFTGKYEVKEDNIFFFDLDGTLIETDYANFLAYKISIETITNGKCTITYNPKIRFTRTSLINGFTYLTNDEVEAIVAMKEREYCHYLYITELNKEVYDLLQIYHKTHNCILVTNCHKERALMMLEYYNLTDCFSKIIFNNTKFHANKYRKAIDYLKITPETIILYEDNEQEICNAKGIGIKVINPILSKIN